MKKLIVLFILTNLIACQNSDGPFKGKRICKSPEALSKDISETSEQESFKNYQIGDNWNRTYMEKPDIFAQQIVQLYYTGFGAVGTGVYIGNYAGEHLILTASHVYAKIKSCEKQVNFLFHHGSTQFFAKCSGWYYKFHDTDLMLFSITTKNPEDLVNLQAPDFDTRHHLGEALNLVSIEKQASFKFKWYIDDEKDCQLLGDQAKILEDPDCSAKEDDLISSVSLPIGCDGKHGDSGAPVYNANYKLKGLLWTGRFPKTNQSSKKLQADKENHSSNLWQDYNYMVPISALEVELDTILKTKSIYLLDKTQSIFKALSKKIKADQKPPMS